jgi:DNA-directed RNA polymerase specialized sigma24 family protein
MERHKIKSREPAPATQIEQLLTGHYGKLLQWGGVLTRGDAGKAEEIVQELCLYFALSKPDLSAVANLDGYLYTCLRHVYLSGIARSSREALHFVSIAQFDSFEFALGSNQSGDLLQRQNDLRRICCYAVWRKESSKSASYFVFHFFHGYARREIAELARLPIAAIYNKLKIARAEVKSYLEEPGKLRVVNRDQPPKPAFSWSLASSFELFRELRSVILRGRLSDCLPQEELLAHYRSSSSRPISCPLLAHIVSCERCLAIVDQHFRRPTLQDREPVDGFGSSSDRGGSTIARKSGEDLKAMLLAVHKRWGRVHEHRPSALSIAVNGRIVASHDVEAEHSRLSARIEHPEVAEFVEVFSEQDVRLALLSIGELPPEGAHVRTQRVELSDDRWLELNLSFDGLGLNSEVGYFDPALAPQQFEREVEAAFEEEAEEFPLALDLERSASAILPWRRRPFALLERMLATMAPSSAMVWAFTLAAVLSIAGYLAYRHVTVPMDAQAILNQSVRIEAANLQGQTEHQVVRIEELSSGGRLLQKGTVDLWKDGDGSRYLRRLYDSQHHTLAAEWRNKSGEHNFRSKDMGKDASGKQSLLMNGFWDQDLSARAFSALGAREARVQALAGGYELTTAGPIQGQLISATLVLDRHLMPIKVRMRVRSGTGINELRFVQQEYARKPSASVPDTMFDPQDGHLHSQDGNPAHKRGRPDARASDVQLAELQIAVLYGLNRLRSDTGKPIEIVRTPDGRLRVSGTIADEALKQQIAAQLESLPNHQLLDLRLLSSRDVSVRLPGPQRALPDQTSVYDINQAKPPADAALRKYFETKGLSGDRLDSAVGQFSHNALGRAQAALQHAYALDRLGNALSAQELTSIGLSSRQQWTEMADKHAFELEAELRTLREQLAEVLAEQSSTVGGEVFRIENPAQFKDATEHLLRGIQELNRKVGDAFASNASAESQPAEDALLKGAINAIPLRQAEEIKRFAVALNASAKTASGLEQNEQNGQDAPNIPAKPR